MKLKDFLCSDNKKGQAIFYSMMLSVALIVLVLAFLPIGQSFVDSAMNQTTGDTIGLDCDNSSISNFQKGTCDILDFSSAYVFGGMLLIALGILTAKITIG
ncbi:hypothetical protein KY342_00135 [Candidatus Woesearchaeota archaeon]|nr:hypothetical protein [Candidatus Woesearchaeota archaeon]